MGANYCNCKDNKEKEKEKKSEVNMDKNEKINYNMSEMAVGIDSNSTPNFNNDYSFTNNSLNKLDTFPSSQELFSNLYKQENLLRNINLEESINENKCHSRVLSLIKEKEQEDEVSEFENKKKNLKRYNSSGIKDDNDFYYNKILINNNKINIFEDNSFNIQYINQSNSNEKKIVKKNNCDKKGFVYEKKINLINNNNFIINNDDVLGSPLLYKKANIRMPKFSSKTENVKIRKDKNIIIYDID